MHAPISKRGRWGVGGPDGYLRERLNRVLGRLLDLLLRRGLELGSPCRGLLPDDDLLLAGGVIHDCSQYAEAGTRSARVMWAEGGRVGEGPAPHSTVQLFHPARDPFLVAGRQHKHRYACGDGCVE